MPSPEALPEPAPGSKHEAPSRVAPDKAAALTPAAQENIEVMTAFIEREDAEVSTTQTVIETISDFFGSPTYFAFVVVFVIVWIGVNGWGWHAGWRHVDEPPFFWLQGLVSSNALLLTVAVLIRQNRMAQLAEHRAHLDLQINLLTERKVTKLLELVDQLRLHQLPPEQHDDGDSDELRKRADPEAILNAIKQTSAER